MAGAAACDAVRESVTVGASFVGHQIAKRVEASTLGDTSAVQQTSSKVDEQPQAAKSSNKQLIEAGGAAVSGLGQILGEIQKGTSLVKQSAATATCAAVGARYGTDAEETLGDAMGAVAAASNFYTGSSILSKRGV